MLLKVEVAESVRAEGVEVELPLAVDADELEAIAELEPSAEFEAVAVLVASPLALLEDEEVLVRLPIDEPVLEAVALAEPVAVCTVAVASALALAVPMALAV